MRGAWCLAFVVVLGCSANDGTDDLDAGSDGHAGAAGATASGGAAGATASGGAAGATASGGVGGTTASGGVAGTTASGGAAGTDAAGGAAGTGATGGSAGTGGTGGTGGGDGCPVLAYPSGIHLRTFPDAAMSAAYDSIADTGCYPRPECWIDVDRLEDPVAGTTYDVSVSLSDHFILDELVGTELPYSHKVLVSPDLVAALETYRAVVGSAVSLTSGFRSPQHQRAVCQGICGQDCCTGGANPCACRSRHEWGDAADIASSNPATLYDEAGQSTFGYCLAETGHLHVDMNPCGAGCPP